MMIDRSKVILSKSFWTESKTKAELKQKISEYMNRNYPNYIVVEVHKYYAICEIERE